MSLFQRFFDRSRMIFNCVGLSDDELKDITKLVEDHGGEVGQDVLPIIFMQKSRYKQELHTPMYRVYDINFIKSCAKRGKIVDHRPFRLGPKKLGESGILSSFIHGVSCYKCAMERRLGSPIIPDSLSSSATEGEHALPVARTISSPGIITSDNSPVNESQLVVSNPFSRSMRRASSDSKVLASSTIVQKPIKQSQSSGKRRKGHLMPNPLSSQETDSFHTATDVLAVKTEPIDSQDWEDVQNIPNSQAPFLPETERADVSDPLDSEIPFGPNTQHQSPETSPTWRPRLRVLNVSQLMPKPNSAQAFQSTQIPPASRTDNTSKAAKVMPLTSSPKKQTSQIVGHQTSAKSAEKPRTKLLYLGNRTLKVNVENIKILPRTSRAAKHVDTNNSVSIPSGTAEASRSVSPTFADSSEQESPWIAPDDTWMNNPKINNRVHPTTEFVQCHDGKVPLLRLNVASGNNVEADDESTTCSDESRDLRASSIKPTKKNTKLIRKVQKSPSPSKKTKETMITASKKKPVEVKASRRAIISDSDDAVENTTTNGSNETLRKKISRITHKNPASRRREKSPSDYQQPGTSGLNLSKRTISVISLLDSDDADVPKTICRTNSKDRDNGNESTRKKHRSPASLKTTSDRNKGEKMNKVPSHVQAVYSTNSDSDAEEEVPAKRRKNGEVEIQRRKKRHKHPAFTTDSEAEDPQDVQRKSDKNVADVNSESDCTITDVADDGDDSNKSTIQRKRDHYNGRKASLNKKALKYAKDWRCQLEASRKVKVEVTRRKFSRTEQQTMVDFLCTHPDIERVQPKGLKVWHELLTRGLLPYRTAQSLQNHFVKSLLPNIQSFFRGMTEEHIAQFKAIQTSTSRKYL